MKKTQTYNDGLVNIYAETQVGDGDGGHLPDTELTLKHTLRYHARTVGLARLTRFAQVGVTVAAVLRTPRRADVSARDWARTQDGALYYIKQVQYPEDVRPASMDLTLEAVRQADGMGGAL